MFDYVLIASFLLYFLVAMKAESLGISKVWASFIVTVPAFLLALYIKYLLWSTPGVEDFPLFTLGSTLTLLAQFVAGVFVFHELDKNSDNYLAWLSWTAVGGVSLFLGIPYLVGMYFP